VETEKTLSGQPVVTSYGYDLLGRMVGLWYAAGNEWGWAFDSLGRNHFIDDPNAGTRTSLFDDAGRVLEVEDALGQRTVFSYDAGGHLETRSVYHADQSLYRTVVYGYSEPRSGYFNVGRLTSVTSPVDVRRTDYDARGRTVHIERDFEGVTYTEDVAFNQAGLRAGLTRAGGPPGVPAVPVQYQYDAAGRVAEIPGLVSSVTYDAAGRPLVRTNANLTTTTRVYDAERGFLDSISTPRPPAQGTDRSENLKDD
jgi:YD repeat-containing protein